MTFDKPDIRRWRRDVWRAFEDAGFKGPQIVAAMVLAAVSVVGTDLKVLSEVTGSSEDYVRKVLRRLRKHRVLSGQTLRVGWDREGEALAVILDGMVASGDLTRPSDPKRSAAQKARAPETRHRGPRRKAAVIVGPYVPARQSSNPYYGLPEWETEK